MAMSAGPRPMRNCHNIRGCPASLYLNCENYLRHVNCWESEAGCVECDRGCAVCKVYKKALELGLARQTV